MMGAHISFLFLLLLPLIDLKRRKNMAFVITFIKLVQNEEIFTAQNIM